MGKKVHSHREGEKQKQDAFIRLLNFSLIWGTIDLNEIKWWAKRNETKWKWRPPHRRWITLHRFSLKPDYLVEFLLKKENEGHIANSQPLARRCNVRKKAAAAAAQRNKTKDWIQDDYYIVVLKIETNTWFCRWPSTALATSTDTFWTETKQKLQKKKNISPSSQHTVDFSVLSANDTLWRNIFQKTIDIRYLFVMAMMALPLKCYLPFKMFSLRSQKLATLFMKILFMTNGCSTKTMKLYDRTTGTRDVRAMMCIFHQFHWSLTSNIWIQL